MKNNLVAEFPGLGCKPGNPWQHKPIEVPGADHQFSLCAEIISEETGIDRCSRLVVEQCIGFKVESTDPLKRRLDHQRRRMHFHHEVFHAEKIHDVVEEWCPETACAIDICCPLQRGQALFKMEVPDVRPWIAFNTFDGFALRKRSGFAEGMFEFPSIKEAPAIRRPVDGIEELRRDPPEIAPELSVKVFER